VNSEVKVLVIERPKNKIVEPQRTRRAQRKAKAIGDRKNPVGFLR